MSIRLKTIPTWVLLSLISNGVLLLAVVLLLVRGETLPENSQANASVMSNTVETDSLADLDSSQTASPRIGPRHQWTYQEWVAQLEREAQAVATKPPKHLTVLAGDSLSLWFPPDLLPTGRTWLNQGISGETSTGLLKRLKALDMTQPETVFIMIGINDLIRGIDDQTLLNNYREIVRDLRWVHPNTQIVVQSILPHSAEKATWESRDRLLAIPNSRIRQLNRELEAIAIAEGAVYLNLHPLFTDEQGKLRPELSTDGLHLNDRGYLVWKSGIQLFSLLKF
ncbi:SGNH/GDSL hydrolase family protein [Lyngbya sp. PCC 8106]|uniref:SGNH/GDSL hydrolase family protein n=1 Tax=Lyngbya sp. (strain PCC 8106) TaxID=313612 RepID=UPI0000EAA86F|nr:SGNH/GDSL hydrolase family protein [Lyngbya sp. PCC 8106]EAW34646.1 Lipolytic enzyme, G-D-S-L [Lyngbya sp. PCC 8106]